MTDDDKKKIQEEFDNALLALDMAGEAFDRTITSAIEEIRIASHANREAYRAVMKANNEFRKLS